MSTPERSFLLELREPRGAFRLLEEGLREHGFFGTGSDGLVADLVARGRIHLWVGGGVVWDSDPQAEAEESWTKARPLLAALGAPLAVRAGSRR